VTGVRGCPPASPSLYPRDRRSASGGMWIQWVGTRKAGTKGLPLQRSAWDSGYPERIAMRSYDTVQREAGGSPRVSLKSPFLSPECPVHSITADRLESTGWWGQP